MTDFAIILYLTNFIETVLIIVGFYVVSKYVFRWLFPFLFQHSIKNMQQKMQDNLKNQQRSNRHEGEVTIENDRIRKPTYSRDEGEYVDFEEVD
jgi:hypothetical protein